MTRLVSVEKELQDVCGKMLPRKRRADLRSSCLDSEELQPINGKVSRACRVGKAGLPYLLRHLCATQDATA
jgi:hypothetical protein